MDRPRLPRPTLREAEGLDDDARAAFLAAATARGYFEPDVSPGFLLEPTTETCAHGLSYDCCPCVGSDL